jgi:hypothetical protein
MFPSLLFCSCLVAFSSAGLVSTNSQVDYTTYGNLLALLSGNTELASPDRVPYLRRLPQHQGKDGNYYRFLQILSLSIKPQLLKFLTIFSLKSKPIKNLLPALRNSCITALLCISSHRLQVVLSNPFPEIIRWYISSTNVYRMFKRSDESDELPNPFGLFPRFFLMQLNSFIERAVNGN